jgi:hypothetical protein
MEAHGQGIGNIEAIKRGLGFLTDICCKRNQEAFGPPGAEQGIHTIHAVLALQKARRYNIPHNPKKELYGLHWLMEHKEEATNLIEEIVTIDPIRDRCETKPIINKQCADYGFMFMTEALLIRALCGAENKEYLESDIGKIAQRRLRQRINETGGFYGFRVFSWSTAKGIHALSALQASGKTELPEPIPLHILKRNDNNIKSPAHKQVYDMQKAALWVAPLIGFIVVAAIVLAALQKLSTPLSVIITVSIVGLLLIIRVIDKDTLKQLARRRSSFWPHW